MKTKKFDMRIKVKKLHPDAKIPKYKNKGDAGMDLTAISIEHDEKKYYVEYGTGLSMEIPEGHVGYIFPRSSSSNYSTIQSNCVGVVDSGFRGELKIRMKELGGTLFSFPVKKYEIGERVAQLIIMPLPKVEFYEEEVLSETERGTDGFGSTGL